MYFANLTIKKRSCGGLMVRSWFQNWRVPGSNTIPPSSATSTALYLGKGIAGSGVVLVAELGGIVFEPGTSQFRNQDIITRPSQLLFLIVDYASSAPYYKSKHQRLRFQHSWKLVATLFH
ncbi:hypothetical protein AVEN_227184-1 [Araneus ventricosus]|uniref:Uncharacterized protein n=1 Tax=Araneus ventricosus TaxID=182803 RepID=A0A4Y2BUM8_ARAVE|nr:hypothetical protein AVEN_227184-1 [Araneus ventricosus]